MGTSFRPPEPSPRHRHLPPSSKMVAMRIRAQHLASLLLLLACLGVAENASLRTPDAYLRGQGIAMLLGQDATGSASVSSLGSRVSSLNEAALTTADHAHLSSVWTLRPPSAHSIARHSVSGSGL